MVYPFLEQHRVADENGIMIAVLVMGSYFLIFLFFFCESLGDH